MAWTKAFSMIRPYGILQETAVGSSKVLSFDSDVAVLLSGINACEIVGLYVAYTATATVGTRQLAVDWLNASNAVLLRAAAATTLIALDTKNVSFGRGLPSQVALGGLTQSNEPLPDGMFLLPGMKLRILDVAAIATGADTLSATVFLRW